MIHRRLIALLLGALLSAPSFAAITLGAGHGAAPLAFTGSGGVLQDTYTNTASGSVIACTLATRNDTGTTITAVDIGGQAATLITGQAVSAEYITIAHVRLTSGGDKLIDVTFNQFSASATAAACVELVGVQATGTYVDAESHTDVGTSNTPTCNITTAASSAIVAIAANSGGGHPTADGTYVDLGMADAYTFNAGEYKLNAGAAGAKTATFGLSGSFAWGSSCIAFLAAGGGGGGSIVPKIMHNRRMRAQQ